MELRKPPRLESRNTDDYLPTGKALENKDESDESDHKVKTSTLPYYIARHRKLADTCFSHACTKEHGLKHILLRKGLLALFWIVVFGVDMVILFYMVTSLMQNYFSVPVATQIKAEQEKMLFPDVTICTKVPFYTTPLGKTENGTLDQMLVEIREAIVAKLKDASIRVTEAAIQGALLIQLATRDDDTLLRAFQHLIYCSYHDRPCSFYNFTEIAHLRYVQCFTFAPNQREISGGKGLQFMFYRKHRSKVPFVMLNDLEDSEFVDPVNDGIHLFIHNQNTFPTYAIDNMATSFSLRYGQHGTIKVTALQYQSKKEGSKSCADNKSPYKYKNFRGGANYLKYSYTYEDCIANMQQRLTWDQCRCYSDSLFVPFVQIDQPVGGNAGKLSEATNFCRDIRQKTSQRLREAFLCFDRYDNFPKIKVLDKFIPMDKLWSTRDDLDERKVQRLQVCPLLCQKIIYSTRFFEVIDLDPNTTYRRSLLTNYMNQLSISQLNNEELKQIWLSNTTDNETVPASSRMNGLSARDLVIVDIRISTELTDVWEEELTESISSLISNLGGTLGLCSGISFLSSVFLVVFFGRAYFHYLVSLFLWFWWSVYLGRPPATPLKHETTNQQVANKQACNTTASGVSELDSEDDNVPSRDYVFNTKPKGNIWISRDQLKDDEEKMNAAAVKQSDENEDEPFESTENKNRQAYTTGNSDEQYSSTSSDSKEEYPTDRSVPVSDADTAQTNKLGASNDPSIPSGSLTATSPITSKLETSEQRSELHRQKHVKPPTITIQPQKYRQLEHQQTQGEHRSQTSQKQEKRQKREENRPLSSHEPAESQREYGTHLSEKGEEVRRQTQPAYRTQGQQEEEISTSETQQKNQPQAQLMRERQLAFDRESEDFPNFIVDPPPPPLVRQTLTDGRDYYVPEDFVIPPLIGQQAMPHYLRENYGNPHEYSTK